MSVFKKSDPLSLPIEHICSATGQDRTAHEFEEEELKVVEHRW